MRETQLSLLDCRDALGEGGRLRTNSDGGCRRGRGHPALQAHPLRRAYAALPLLFFGAGEGAGDRRKLQLDTVDDLAQPRQFASQDGWSCRPHTDTQAIGGERKTSDLVACLGTIVGAITHFCSIHSTV